MSTPTARLDLAAIMESLQHIKQAFQPMAPPGPPVDPATGQPMQDPAMMGGAPPVDPATGMPMGGDPAAGGMPPVDPATGMPMDPNMMDPAMMGGAPPPEAAPPGGGEMEQVVMEMTDIISQLSDKAGQLEGQNKELMEGMQTLQGEFIELSTRFEMIEKLIRQPSPAEGMI